jgi:diguanylate cyclase (GGDEF)-like protein
MTCRDGDTPARYGGEELAVILTGAEDSGATEFAERVRAAVAGAAIPLEGGETLRMTASLGVATLGADVADAAGLLAAADRALYAAKRSGKNRVVHADDAGASPAGSQPSLLDPALGR